jgi:ketosteroid isomerase-like protein
MSFGVASAALAQEIAIHDRTQRFLEAYARGDVKAILPLIDRSNVTMYGSDVAEVAHGADALVKLLDADQKLWGGTAHMGAMQNVTLVQDRNLASIVFDVAFSVGGRPPVPVRVTAIWKREGKQWLLIQSSNAVLSEHQSAEELTRQP